MSLIIEEFFSVLFGVIIFIIIIVVVRKFVWRENIIFYSSIFINFKIIILIIIFPYY